MRGFIIALSLMPSLGVTAEKKPLDGLFFAGETGEKGKEKGDPERFQFEGAMFDPLECHVYKFAATPYVAKVGKDQIEFEAEHTNPDGWRMRWVGVVKGDQLFGTMLFWDGGKTPKEYWFRAKRQAKR